ncbi:hypothetical protein [Streptococcus acidominimus]|uniref:Uncharacterized protein n=1 Tax=Streptococcus acidominimus TaxID=1326 RepID=A0A1Q8EFW3_STRAI|nr:hypothetical protein [Streptococcus acidominimus]OLF50672.1 hypothetical protein BU200_01240 [Streptococcus acidominimus]SUN04996.1 Uncharacterised protein [Streptococcus acidominimus]SUN41211.1 Uncharacterised protein [Streptococcus acidominimus]
MRNDILDEYEYLISDLDIVIGSLKIIHHWLDGNLDYYERDFRMGAKKDPLERSSWGNFGAKKFKSIQIH